jgi:hypothetical protein
MVNYLNLVDLFLAQTTQPTQQTVLQAKDLLIVVIIPVLTTLIGVITGLITAWKNQSDVYKDRLEQYKTAFDRNLDSVGKAYEAEKRSLELLLKQKESDIENLKIRIKRMEGFYSIHFTDIDKGNTILEKLILFVKYIENRVQDKDPTLTIEVQKMQDYLESQLGLVDRQKFRFEAVDWLRYKSDFLIKQATEYILPKLSNVSYANAEENIKKYLDRLTIMLRAGVGTEGDSSFIEKTKKECMLEYVEALRYIKDNLIGGQISTNAYEELRGSIDFLIEIINS